jgi:hypothetical protein
VRKPVTEEPTGQLWLHCTMTVCGPETVRYPFKPGSAVRGGWPAFLVVDNCTLWRSVVRGSVSLRSGPLRPHLAPGCDVPSRLILILSHTPSAPQEGDTGTKPAEAELGAQGRRTGLEEQDSAGNCWVADTFPVIL